MEPELTPFEYEQLDDEEKANYFFDADLQMYILNPRADKFLWNVDDLESTP